MPANNTDTSRVPRRSVMIVEDHPVTMRGVKQYLERIPAIELVGEATTGEEALHNATSLHPEVIVLDWFLPDLPGDEIVRRLKAAHPEIKIIAYTVANGLDEKHRMLAAGADAYINKYEDPSLLVQEILRTAP